MNNYIKHLDFLPVFMKNKRDVKHFFYCFLMIFYADFVFFLLTL
eukprot:UN26898